MQLPAPLSLPAHMHPEGMSRGKALSMSDTWIFDYGLKKRVARGTQPCQRKRVVATATQWQEGRYGWADAEVQAWLKGLTAYLEAAAKSRLLRSRLLLLLPVEAGCAVVAICRGMLCRLCRFKPASLLVNERVSRTRMEQQRRR